MKTNRAGIELIKTFEGLRTKSYLCPAGVWTIGYGHTSAAGAPKVTKGMTITPEQAEEILVSDLVNYEAGVLKALKRSPNVNQFSAMVSLCYNIGEGAFASSSVVRMFNEGAPFLAADALMKWNKAKVSGKLIELPGLTRRRDAERKLFLTPVQGGDVVLPPDLPDDHAAPPVEAPKPRKTLLEIIIDLIVNIFTKRK